jgi:hypothetical protein
MIHPRTESLAGSRLVAWAVGCVSQYREKRANSFLVRQVQDNLRP